MTLLLPAALAAQAVRTPPAAPPSPVIQTVPVVPLSGAANFISPAGEPVRSHDTASGAEHWFQQIDADHDGRITRAEFRADFDRFFTALDVDHDGEIGPDEIERYESEIAPEIRVASSYGDPALAKSGDDGTVTPPPYPTRLGAGRFGFLDMPEPIVAADTNLDRAITRIEMRAAADKRFAMLDANGDGAITRDELPRLNMGRGGGRGQGDDGAGGARRHGHRRGGYTGGEIGG